MSYNLKYNNWYVSNSTLYNNEDTMKLIKELKRMNDGDNADLRDDIKFLEKQIRKNNGYKNIKIEKDGYIGDRVVTKITFPIGTKKSFKKIWLENQGYPLEDKRYNVYSEDGRDCTGQLHTVYVESDKNIFTIVQLFDM